MYTLRREQPSTGRSFSTQLSKEAETELRVIIDSVLAESSQAALGSARASYDVVGMLTCSVVDVRLLAIYSTTVSGGSGVWCRQGLGRHNKPLRSFRQTRSISISPR